MSREAASGILVILKYHKAVLLPNTMYSLCYYLFKMEAKKFLAQETFTLFWLNEQTWALTFITSFCINGKWLTVFCTKHRRQNKHKKVQRKSFSNVSGKNWMICFHRPPCWVLSGFSLSIMYCSVPWLPLLKVKSSIKQHFTVLLATS